MMRYAALMLLALVGCGDNPIQPPPPPPPPPRSVIASVDITPSPFTVRPDDSLQLTAVVRDTLGHVRTDFPITWTSSDTAVATVTSTGLVAGTGQGVAEIRAMADSVSGRGTMTVLARLSMDGVWDFRQTVSDLRFPIICSDTGSFAFTQEYRTFHGPGDKVSSCSVPVGTVIAAPLPFGTGTFTGQIAGSQVKIQLSSYSNTYDTCEYTGVVPLPPADTVSGTVQCSIYYGSYQFAGTWSAHRGVPPASVAIDPPAWHMVPGGKTQFKPVLRDAAGNRLFVRLLAWSSDDTLVASVSASGLVTATGPGTTTIRAAFPGASAGATALDIAHVDFTDLSVGYEFACGTTPARVACWGDNKYGELGNGFTANASEPVFLDDNPRFVRVRVAKNGFHACGVTAAGAGYCWGHNHRGVLGDGTNLQRRRPVPVSGVGPLVSIEPGHQHTCALAADSTAWCWGDNSEGQLARARSPSPVLSYSFTPLLVSDSLKFVQLTVGSAYSCGLTAGGDAHCWGTREEYSDSGPFLTPTRVSGGVPFKSITTGMSHTCGLTDLGQAYCWGGNTWGQLGIGSFADATSPQPVAGGLAFQSLNAGAYHTCGVSTAGEGYCWGRNGWWLGTDWTVGVDGTSSPAPVLGGLTFSTIAPGTVQTCGLTTDGVAYCWGPILRGMTYESHTPYSATPQRVIGQR